MWVPAIALTALVVLLLPSRKTSRVKVEIGQAVLEESDPIDRMLQLAQEHLELWGEIDEHDDEAAPLLDLYWSGTGVDGRAQDLHWSGAFIQWLANEGSPGSLPQLAQHSAYAMAALGEERPGKFQTLPPDTAPEVGDIILKPRPGEGRSFEDLSSGVPFPAHGDLIVEVEPNRVLAVGGNKLGDRVSIEYYPRDTNGRVQGIFALLRLNTENMS
jgi:hypothetical protein